MADRTVVVRLIGDTSSYENAMRRAAGATGSLNTQGQRSIITLGNLGRLAGTYVAASVIKAGVSFESLKQTSQAAFTTMLGSASAARGELGKLYDFALHTPFAYPMILQAAQQMKAYGMETEKIIPTLHAVGDATAAMGGSADIFQRVVTAIGQIQAKGTVQAEEFRQLAEAGIPAWQTLAQYLGVSIPQAMSMVEKRSVSAEQGIAALTQGIENRFGGAMDALGNTWRRSVDRFTARLRTFGADVMEPLMAKAQKGMTSIGDALKNIGPTLGSALSIVASVMTPIGAVLGLLGKIPGSLGLTALALGGVYLASKRLNAIVPAMRAQWGSFGEQMRVQQALATASGASLTRLGAAATVAGFRVQAAGKAIWSAFGGGIGLAIIGITTALGIYSQRQAEAKQRAQEHQQAVDELTASLDKNTLSLSQNDRDTQLAGLVHGDALHYLNQIPGATELARKAIAGDAAALAQLRTVLADPDGQLRFAAKGTFEAVSGAADNLRDSIGKTADAMKAKLPDAATATGVSLNSLTDALKEWSRAASQGKPESLTTVLSHYNVTADQAAKITQILGATAANAGAGFDTMASAAAQAAASVRQSISQGLTGFVSPTGAWDAVVQRKQQAMSGGGGSAAKTPKVGDDPAVKSITARIKAFKRQQDATAANLKAEVDSAKVWEKAEKKKAEASQKAADATKKAADEAAAVLTKAQDRKTKADQNAQDAANILAAVQHAALQAGTADSLSWASAVQKATEAASAAKSEQVAATQGLATAQDNANTTAAKAKTATDANATAQKNYKDAQDRATAASQHQQTVNDRLARRYQKMLDAKNRAEDKARQSTEAMSQGGSSAVGGMVDNVKVSLQEYLDELQHQVDTQTRWKDNLIRIAGRVAPGVANALAALGPSAAPLVDQLVNGTQAQLDKFSALFPKSTEAGVQGMTDQLTQSTSIVSQVAKTLGTKAAQKLADGLASGKIKLKDALFQLQGVVDKNSLDVKLGISNKKDMAKQLDNLFKGHVYKMIPWTGPGGVKGFQVGPVKGYRRGGWIKGGSGVEDDVPVGPNAWGMGGEFMVTKSIAQANKPFFDYLDRHGRMPQPVASPVHVSFPQPVDAGPRIVNHNTFNVVQQPGQDANGLVREMDRLSDLLATR